MQECETVDITKDELAEFNAFKTQKKIEEAKGLNSRLECDMLSPNLTRAELKNFLAEAVRLNLGAVCVAPAFVGFCAKTLGQESPVSVIACISRPDGGDVTDIKVKAVKRAVKDGADEAEVCAPLAAIKEHNWGYVKREFKKVKRAARSRAARVVLQTPLLTDAERCKCCALAADAGISCVRLSCGKSDNGESELAAAVKKDGRDKYAVKVSGVKNAADFRTAISLGADMVSCTNALQTAAQILSEATSL